MKRIETILGGAAVLALVTAILAAPVYARMGQGMMQGQKDSGPAQMATVMQDMSKLMTRMSDQFSQGTMNAEMLGQMADRMKRMSTMMAEMSGMMGQMSGMMGGPMMMDSGMQTRMDRMREHMAEMMSTAPMPMQARTK